MGELRYRGQFNTTIPLELIEEVDKLSKETKIPKSTLTEEAIRDLINKYKKLRKKK